ncbi:nucleoid-associated protein [Pedobacter panaciterrae]|uniref:nucleoid-associated protein n=1 Tax=Pedobacter panaciterrae TaxID=363849 RepID=UPI002592297E|nr:nucleoid-associated protein [uncultured Pedobacter sp.]
MQVHKLVIHQLEKEAKVKGIKEYNSSEALMALNPGIDRMYELIHESFENDKTRHCKFKLEEVSNSVLLNTNHYLEDDDFFLKYTKASLDNLASRIENVLFASGGYYLFADYTVNQKRFMSIILVRNKEGFVIAFNDRKKNFDFNDTKNINTDKLAMGYRLNVNLYLNRETDPDRNYMALLTNQGDDLSDYFLEWVNASEAVNGKIQTGILINAIKQLGSDDPDEGEADFQGRVYDLIMSYRKGNKGSINIDNISEVIYGQKRRIRDYIELSLERDIDPDIRPDGSILKKLIQIKAQVKGINVTFDVSKLGNEVDYDGGVLIIRNENLVNQIKSQREFNG